MNHPLPVLIGGRSLRRSAMSIAIASSLVVTGVAHAFEIPIDNPELAIRWDNTFRYNLANRVQGQNSAILNAANNDDGDRNFAKGSLVQNRIDVLSEFDLVWQRKFGFRASAAGWWDAAYGSLDNTSSASANTLVNGLPAAGVLSKYTQRYAKGASGEVLDAFAFANVDFADVPVSVKVGQHTVFWGDSLLLGGAVHSVSYGQYSLDVWKGFATPGVEAKELFRPRQGITLQAQPAHDLSVAAQWFWDWQAVRVPESGSYLGMLDYVNYGADSFILGPNPGLAINPAGPALGRLWRGTDITPRTNRDYGLAARWSPDWLDGTLGFYVRNTADIFPQAMATPGVQAGIPAATCGAIGGTALGPSTCLINPKATSLADLTKYGKLGLYNTAYGEDIHLFGVSLAKSLAGVSFGAELSYRQHMPLVSSPVTVVPAPLVPGVPGSIATTAVPAYGTPGALGNTWHGLLNAILIFPKSAVFDTATLQGELTAMHLGAVTQNPAAYNGRPDYSAIDKPTNNYAGLAVNFTPTWFQVFPGVDLLAPLSWSQGVYGNAAVALGGNKGTGQWGAGVAFDIYQKYRVDLKYVGFYGNRDTNAAGVMTTPNGLAAALADRGYVALTLKATF